MVGEFFGDLKIYKSSFFEHLTIFFGGEKWCSLLGLGLTIIHGKLLMSHKDFGVKKWEKYKSRAAGIDTTHRAELSRGSADVAKPPISQDCIQPFPGFNIRYALPRSLDQSSFLIPARIYLAPLSAFELSNRRNDSSRDYQYLVYTVAGGWYLMCTKSMLPSGYVESSRSTVTSATQKEQFNGTSVG